MLVRSFESAANGMLALMDQNDNTANNLATKEAHYVSKMLWNQQFIHKKVQFLEMTQADT